MYSHYGRVLDGFYRGQVGMCMKLAVPIRNVYSQQTSFFNSLRVEQSVSRYSLGHMASSIFSSRRVSHMWLKCGERKGDCAHVSTPMSFHSSGFHGAIRSTALTTTNSTATQPHDSLLIIRVLTLLTMMI